MSGETENRPSGWTVDTLKHHFEDLLTERDKYLEAVLAEKDKALIAALVAVKEENRKTEVGAEKRFDLLNELRDGVATKEQLEALEKIVTNISDRINRSEGSRSGQQLSKANFYAALGAVGVIISLVVLLANGFFK